MEHEQNAKPIPNDVPRRGRVYSTLKEYHSKDIREVKRQGQTVKYVKKGKGNKLGAGGQSGIYEVVVDTGVEHLGYNPRYQTYAAKKFSRASTNNLHGQWQEEVSGLSEYYSGYICQFYGYCRNYEYYEGSDEDSEDGYETASETVTSEPNTSEHWSFETSSDEGYESASENAFETGSYCLLMRKYDSSLRTVLDEEMRKNHNTGKPLLPGVAVNMMVQIALGMKIVHHENIIHGDLKADNVFVYKDATDNMPWKAHIGDFEISNSPSGSAYWRAPEILESAAKRKVDRDLKLPWTPMADVYSYAMICYEILTGGIPLQGHPRVQYQDVSQRGLRPVLPMELNSAVRNLIARCWHQDPLERPTFDAILLEWRELLHEIPEFLESLDNPKMMLLLRNKPSTEECISRLERQFQDLRSKYPAQFFVRRNEVDFVKMGFHLVKCIKRVVRKFGSKPYIDHPSLPWSQWFARNKWIDKMKRLSIELDLALPYFEETQAITIWRFYIFAAISEGCLEVGSSWTEEEGTNYNQMEAKLRSWNENVKKRPPLVNRHLGCVQKYNYGHYEGNKDYPICSFCKVKKKVGNAPKPTFRLFDNKFVSITG